MPTHSPARSTPTGPPSRPRGRAFLAATAASALALGALLGAGTAATAAPADPTPSYEVESTIPVTAGIPSRDALYNPVNKSSFFLAPDSDLVVVVDSDGTVTNLTVSEPSSQAIDADGNVWIGGSGATAGRNLTRISPSLAMTGVTMPAVQDLAVNTATGDIVTINDGPDGLVSTTAPDLTVSSWNLGESSRNSHITVNPTTGNIYLATARDTAGTTEYGVWVYSPSGTELSSIPTADMPRRGAYNPTTGRLSVTVADTGVLVINPDLTNELLAVPVGTSSSLDLRVLPDGRGVVTTAGPDPVSVIATDNTFTSYPITYSLGATMNATGTIFISASSDGVLVIHPDGTTEMLSPPDRPSGIVYNAATDRVVVAGLNTGLVSIIKAVAAAITPINILTPADGATVEPGFTVTGTGETGATVEITDAAKAVVDSFEITNADGSFSYTTDTALTAGTYAWTLTQDADSSADTLAFTINAAPVITPVTITGPDAGSTVGLRPTLTGAGTPDAIVTITDGSVTLGTATVGTTGTWTFTPTADLALGAHTFTATQDVDSSSASVAVTVATTVPNPDPTPSPTPGTGAGNGELSSTGADAAPLLLIGGLLAAAGITAAVLGRRQRQQAA